jgi:hypothetical protein
MDCDVLELVHQINLVLRQITVALDWGRLHLARLPWTTALRLRRFNYFLNLRFVSNDVIPRHQGIVFSLVITYFHDHTAIS